MDFDNKKRSIFHIAVENSHENIFNLLEIGSFRDLLADLVYRDGNNLLHLVARLASQGKLNAILGAAHQCNENYI